MSKKSIICWWSGGITSAVATKIAIDIYGKENCRVIMIDTHNEHPDTYRFKDDCAKWYDIPIETITAIGQDYDSIQDVWIRHKSLNVATGAICSTQLKRRVREKWQKTTEYDHQVFGFEFDKKEFNRALSMTMNHSGAKPIYPLLMMGLNKEDCIKIIEEAGIVVPVMYQMGFRNNNCFNTGCVQGGVGYWQKMRRDFPEKFDAMAEMKHRLTDLKGSPVCMLKDQSKAAKSSGNELVFLKKHPEYPNLKSIDEMPDCKVEPLFECNGFCGINDLIERNKSEENINFSAE
jgi:hypothetical protein